MWLNGGYDPIPGYKANVRSSDNKVLGVVSDKYRIVQNADAFAFTDALIGGDVHYETAAACLTARRSGCWQSCPIPKSAEIRQSLMSASPTHMTAPALSASA